MQQIDLGLSQKTETLVLDADQSDSESSATVQYHPGFIDDNQASGLYHTLSSLVEWQEETLWIAGKERKVPRLIAWYGDKDAEYQYSGKSHQPMPWIRPLALLKEQLEKELTTSFNSVLCNLYRNGQDSMGWHADNEKELGDNPVIASVSLGATRKFQLKHKTNSQLRHKMLLTSGSLLVMQGTTQDYWLHQVPKELKVNEPRINLTFRNIIES
ncbi:alpha-ketoglutarate-dependent dioxygenase AlkB [Kangiella sp. HD9-110m-PIT-SAG07]|nr:alpha-ketoglutarate-dependent dioxygenase AlkB [Kangiella sp. HD9-110m-PIT-SAG07]